ncbi:hypothetical protein BDU57DRAFT_511406 [Ampelomyces quisqualis]|uniref:Uncharacterized protein n=1 Tax=Ampelomyces quisqualis TaxID=50730 RepID=A0A6A5QVV4_AMPQU|nr:hypothetical protein BDU57DRAFT_511406 [Ampelomyces quisqualis]
MVCAVAVAARLVATSKGVARENFISYSTICIPHHAFAPRQVYKDSWRCLKCLFPHWARRLPEDFIYYTEAACVLVIHAPPPDQLFRAFNIPTSVLVRLQTRV